MVSFADCIEIIDEKQLESHAEAWPAPYAVYLGELLGDTEGVYPVCVNNGVWVIHPAFASWLQKMTLSMSQGLGSELLKWNSSDFKHDSIEALAKAIVVQAENINKSYMPGLPLPEEVAFNIHQALMVILMQLKYRAVLKDYDIATVSVYSASQAISYLVYLFSQIEDLRPKGISRLWKQDKISSSPESEGVVQNINTTLQTLLILVGKQAAPSLAVDAIEGFYSTLAEGAAKSPEGWDVFSGFGWSMSGLPTDIVDISKVHKIAFMFLQKLCLEVDGSVPLPLDRKENDNLSDEEFSMILAGKYYQKAYDILLPLTGESAYLVFILHGLAVQHVLMTWITSALFQYNLFSNGDKLAEAESVAREVAALIALLESEINALIQDDGYWEAIKRLVP